MRRTFAGGGWRCPIFTPFPHHDKKRNCTDQRHGSPQGSGYKGKVISNNNILFTFYVEVINLGPKCLPVKCLFWGEVSYNATLRHILCCTKSSSEMQWESQTFHMRQGSSRTSNPLLKGLGRECYKEMRGRMSRNSSCLHGGTNHSQKIKLSQCSHTHVWRDIYSCSPDTEVGKLWRSLNCSERYCRISAFQGPLGFRSHFWQ